jgi:hypothetical protein
VVVYKTLQLLRGATKQPALPYDLGSYKITIPKEDQKREGCYTRGIVIYVIRGICRKAQYKYVAKLIRASNSVVVQEASSNDPTGNNVVSVDDQSVLVAVVLDKVITARRRV